MTPERMAALVARWVRFYTWGLPGPVAERRIDEIAADLHDHIAHERTEGTGERRIALVIAGRMVRGLAADASWRRRARPRTSSVFRVALVTTCILLVPFVGTLVSDEVAWDLADFIVAGTLLAGSGLLLELAARRPRNVVYRVAATALGVATVLFGQADDAPGLVLIGGALLLGSLALSVRTAWRGE
jgi:hypothetical protein